LDVKTTEIDENNTTEMTLEYFFVPREGALLSLVIVEFNSHSSVNLGQPIILVLLTHNNIPDVLLALPHFVSPETLPSLS
jgi:hypothetical protein